MEPITATATAPETTGSDRPQHLQALERANRVRLARASLKRAIGSGDRAAAEVIGECPWEAESMTLSELLRSQPRWGRTRTRKLLGSLGLSENKRLDTLTERQRSLLIEKLSQS